MSTTILIVEDDPAIATGLSLNLRMEGYQVSVAGNGEDALEQAAAFTPSLILLDISLPRKNGLEVLEELRRDGNHTPVIVLSARQDEFDKVAALRLGADDYVTKPFALAELLARVVAVLRRTRAQTPVPLPTPSTAPSGTATRFGTIAVDLGTRTVLRDELEVRLTHLEFELLSFFLERPARVFAREEILRQVWGLAHSSSARTVDNFMAQLRAKLEEDPEKPRNFVTVRGSGYRFDP